MLGNLEADTRTVSERIAQIEARMDPGAAQVIDRYFAPGAPQHPAIVDAFLI